MKYSDLPVDLASFLLAHDLKHEEGGSKDWIGALLQIVERSGRTPDDAVEIVRRAVLTYLMQHLVERGYSSERIADSFRSLAERITSGEAASHAAEYREELLKLGIFVQEGG